MKYLLFILLLTSTSCVYCHKDTQLPEDYVIQVADSLNYTVGDDG
jgi:hypothetical protein